MRQPGRLLAALAAGVVLAACDGTPTTGTSTSSTSTSTPQPLAISVDTSLIPVGSVPVAYGDAQVSVPRSWTVTLAHCPAVGETIILGSPRSACVPVGGDLIWFLAFGARPANAEPTTVHGITGWVTYLPTTIFGFPSLGVELHETNLIGTPVSDVDIVNKTLTYSPRAVALAKGPIPTVPASWHRESFGGLSVAVPSTWKTVELSEWPFDNFCNGISDSGLTLGSPPTLRLDTGTQGVPFQMCLQDHPDHTTTEAAAVDGVEVDPGRDGPLIYAGSLGPCLHIHDLPACLSTSDDYGTLVLAVHVPGRKRPVAVEIGLAGNGMTARTILWSMRASG